MFARVRGDGSLYSPADILWFLHYCVDTPEGTLESDANGIGRFTEIVLHPSVTLADPSRADELDALHAKAHAHCFIGNSLNTPVVVRS